MEIKKKIAAVLAAATTLMSTFGAMGVSALTEPIVGDKMGDINKDDNITVADYVMLSNYLTGQGELTAEQAVIADMTRDGVLSVFDQILLGRTVLGERLPELVEKVTETTEPTEPTTEPVTEAETTEPATEPETDPTEAVTTTEAPATTAKTPTTTIASVTKVTTTTAVSYVTTVAPSGKINATIKESNGNYKFSFDNAIGEEVYIVIDADETVTFANGCVGFEVTLDEVSYWVSYKWEADGSETVKVDLTTPTEITYNSGKNKVTDEALIAEISEAVMAKTSGEVQVWWANDAEGEEVSKTLVVLAGAYIIKEAEVTTPVTTTGPIVTTVVEVPTTVIPTTTEAVETTTVEVSTTEAPDSTIAVTTTVTDAVTTTEAAETTTVSTLAFPYEFKIDATNTAAVAYVKFTITTDTAVNYNGAVQFFVEDVNTDVEFSSADAVDGVITVEVPETITNPSAIKLIKICKYWQSDDEATVALTEVKALVGGKEIDSYVQPDVVIENPYEFGTQFAVPADAEGQLEGLTFKVNGSTGFNFAVIFSTADGDTATVNVYDTNLVNGTATVAIPETIDASKVTNVEIQKWYQYDEAVTLTVYDMEFTYAEAVTE